MDCPICYETISKETGEVTTSCGHTFHFKCLNTWYWQQTQQEEGRESCPCCRKEPGEFERASTVTANSEEEWEEFESQEIAPAENPEWIRVAPNRWIIPSSEENRLQILAQIASEQPKFDPFYIPPYNDETHAYWLLRNLFEEGREPAAQMETINSLDRPKMVRRRRRSWGRTFWCRLGNDYNLDSIDGYKSD